MGYINTWVKLTVEVENQKVSTARRAIDSVLRPTIEDPRVKGFDVLNTEKVVFFRRGRYVK